MCRKNKIKGVLRIPSFRDGDFCISACGFDTYIVNTLYVCCNQDSIDLVYESDHAPLREKVTLIKDTTYGY